LPHILRRFSESYPRIRLHLHQGTVEQIAEMVRSDVVDLAMATGSRELFPKWVLLPCYQWRRCLIVPHGHRLACAEVVTLRDLADYPLITYAFSFSGPSALQSTFADCGLTPQIALTAWDADVIKTYVRQGLGVGIIAEMALDATEDADLVRLEIAHLFQPHQTWIGFPRHALLRQNAYRLLELIAAHLNQATVRKAEACADQVGVDALFAHLVLPGPATFRDFGADKHLALAAPSDAAAAPT
jgi:LysR family cys regulon transcriptional activator